MSKSPLERPNHGESNDTVFVLFLRNRNRGCVSKANSRGKIPVAIPRFLLRERIKNTPSFDSPWFDLSYGAFAIVYSSLVTLLWLIHRDSRNLRGPATFDYHKALCPLSSKKYFVLNSNMQMFIRIEDKMV